MQCIILTSNIYVANLVIWLQWCYGHEGNVATVVLL